MMVVSHRRIYDLALEFRHGIERARDQGLFKKPPFNRFPTFNCFPSGCCGDASELLAQFFLEHGIRTKYIVGEYQDDNPYNSQRHAWLSTEDGTIIDITGDQFASNPLFLCYDIPCYVGKIDSLHKKFEVIARQSYEFSGFNYESESAIHGMKDLYQKIIHYIPEQKKTKT